MTALSFDARGAACLELPDAEGEVHAYSLRRVPPGLSDWAIEVTRLDTGEAHRVSLSGTSWRCGCPDWRYRRGREGQPGRGCKHVRGVRDVYLFLRQLEAEPCP